VWTRAHTAPPPPPFNTKNYWLLQIVIKKVFQPAPLTGLGPGTSSVSYMLECRRQNLPQRRVLILFAFVQILPPGGLDPPHTPLGPGVRGAGQPVDALFIYILVSFGLL
jgi:hypothetical protein